MLNLAITSGVLLFGILYVRRQLQYDPNFKVMNFSAKKYLIVLYVAFGINVLLFALRTWAGR